MTTIEKHFSALVFGLTLPKPMEVRLEKVKYSAVMYLVCRVGPEQALPL